MRLELRGVQFHRLRWTSPDFAAKWLIHEPPSYTPVATSAGFSRGISLVIPAWNEEDRLPSTLENYLPVLKELNIDHEVIVVTDGSNDRTAEVALDHARQGVRVLRFEHKLGKGGAVLEGFRRSNYSIVGFIDADSPVAPCDVATLIAAVSECDGAIASRWLDQSIFDHPARASRIALSKTWNLLVRMLLGLHVRDTQCGAKFFRREAIERVLPRITLTNWAFDAALLFHLTKAGFSIRELPVHWKSDPRSKLNVFRAAPTMFISLVGLRLMNSSVLPRRPQTAATWLPNQIR